ncbi:MAG: serine/threonine protein kinase [Acidobacteria bacterium]|nr:serine/threonine protein kinase [Acidobacteriota bacterium]
MDIAALKTLNRLVEQVLDLAPSDRTTWVESLGPEYEAFKPRLRAMLDRLEATGDAAFLASLPTWDATIDAGHGHPGQACAAGALVGRYRLVSEIAAGGQGAVWLAERADGMVDRPVALKLPLGLAFRPGLADRMSREREILARLTHPHIARLYDAGVSDDGTPFLALEYVDGRPVDRFVADHRLGVDAILRLFVQIVDAVAYAHGQLVIHRDLKPSNILVTGDGQVRLLDFGIAKLIDDAPERDSTMTVVGGRALTLAYASPEQVLHETLGVATDVYSLGVVLYELLCGRRPHVPARDTSGALEHAILHDEPPLPSQVALDPSRRGILRGDLDTILLKALKKAPAERYAAANALGDDLRRYLDGLPVSARADSPAYRLRKFVARHRLAVGASAAVLAAVVAGAGVAVWQARVARAERDRADAVKAFVTSVFRDIDPALRGSGRPLTATDVLAQAVDRLDRRSELAAEPAVRAELLRVLGASFLGVGDADRANEILPRALAETTTLTGAGSDEAIDTEIRLARAKYLGGKVDEANAHVAHVRQVLADSGRLASEAFVELELLRTEIIINRGGFRKPEARTAAEEALGAAERLLPPVHQLRARALQQMATVMRWQNEDAAAAAHAERAYRMLLDVQGNDARHISVIMAQNEYGRALYQVGRTREALSHLKEAAANGNASLKDDAVLRQHLLGTLANSQLQFGEVKEGLANLDLAISLDLRGVNLSPAYLAGQRFVRARAYLAARRLEEALRLYDASVAEYTKLGDRNTLMTATSERADVLVRLGRLREAEQAIAPVIASRGRAITPAVRRGVWLQAEIHRRRGETTRAMPLVREAINFEPTNTANAIARAQYQVTLALSLLATGSVPDARAAVEAALAALRANQGVMNPIQADALAALAQVECASANRAAGLALLEQVDAFWQAFDATLPDAVEAARRLRDARAGATAPR